MFWQMSQTRGVRSRRNPTFLMRAENCIRLTALVVCPIIEGQKTASLLFMRVPPIMKTPADRTLFQRAEHALASLQYQEKAALFHAAANTLQMAMAEAKTGDSTKLHEWLESHGDLLNGSSELAFSGKVGIAKFENRSLDAISKQIHGAFVDPNIRIDLPMAVNESMADVETTSIEESRLVAAPSAKEASTETPSAVKPDRDEVGISPWHSMEKSAIRRMKARQIEQKTSPMIAVPRSEAVLSVEEQYRVDTSTLEAKGNREQSAWRRFAAPHIWVSLLVHVIAVPILGYIVVSQVVREKKLAIVSAAAESDEVLTETALEMPSMMEEADLSPPVSDPIEPTLPSDLSLSALEPMGTSPSTVTSTSKSLAQALESGKGTPPSNKLVMGAEFFGVKATGNTFVYIVDCSPSMKKDGAFEAAKQEIGRSLMSMKPTQRFHLMFFGKEIESLFIEPGKVEEYPIYATPSNIQKAVEWLGRSSIQKEGWPPNDSLNKAIDMQPDGIFMLFDGDTRSDVAKHLSKVNRTADILSEPGPKVPIHVIHFFQEEFAGAMRKVANENAGSYRFVTRPERNKSTKK